MFKNNTCDMETNTFLNIKYAQIKVKIIINPWAYLAKKTKKERSITNRLKLKFLQIMIQSKKNFQSNFKTKKNIFE